MTNTILNKKGNTGYHVIAYNFSFCRRLIDGDWVGALNTYSKDIDVYTFMVQKVTVHSCGKKIMRLQSINRCEMQTHRTEYNPETEIYTTREAAVNAATAKFYANPESIGKNCNVIDDPYTGPR